MVTASSRLHRPAAVVGSGPNGLAAAITLARAGVPVTVFEAADTIGGGARTSELVQPGVVHDVCSAIHPMALSTGFFRAFALTERMDFAVPQASYANPLPGVHEAPIAYRDLDRTVRDLGSTGNNRDARDSRAYQRLLQPLVARSERMAEFATGGSLLRLPRDWMSAAQFAARVFEQGTPLWNLRFQGAAAPALLTGAIAHAVSALPRLPAAGVGLLLGALAHTVGWPVPIGGSQRIVDVMAADLLAHGGTIRTGTPIDDLRALGDFGVVLCDTSPHDLLRMAGRMLPAQYRRALRRYRYGNGASKVDFVLDGPIPWRDERLHETATVHLGGSRADMQRAAASVARGRHAEHPIMLLAQPTAFDPGRNPAGVHTVWAYAHVPAGSTRDLTGVVAERIEQFAPGFRDRVTASHAISAAAYSRYNRNARGGDFSVGALSLRQLIARPVPSRTPWKTPVPGLYLASSATPPGPGVHGLSGWFAARIALRDEYGIAAPSLEPR